MRILCAILAIIAAGNISVAIFITMSKIADIKRGKKGYGTVLYFAFTILGIYAAKYLLMGN